MRAVKRTKEKKAGPPPSRRASLTALLVLLGVFALVSLGVVSGLTQSLDRLVLSAVGSVLPESLRGGMIFFTTLGYYRVCAFAALVAAAVFFRIGWRVSAPTLLVSTFGGIVATTVLKSTFGRERPSFGGPGYAVESFSFPSGHATMAAGFYGVLAAILFAHLRGPARWVVAGVGVVVAFMIGLSRLYLGVHYPTDVLAGYLVSPVLVSAFFFLRSFFRPKKDRGR